MVVFYPVPLPLDFQFMIRTTRAYRGRRKAEPYPSAVVRREACAFAALVDGLVKTALPPFAVLPIQLTMATEALLRLQSQVSNLQRCHMRRLVEV